jgi:hypothetical protein
MASRRRMFVVLPMKTRSRKLNLSRGRPTQLSVGRNSTHRVGLVNYRRRRLVPFPPPRKHRSPALAPALPGRVSADKLATEPARATRAFPIEFTFSAMRAIFPGVHVRAVDHIDARE